MRITIIGVGNVGGNLASQFAKAGYEVFLTFSRDKKRLEALAHELGNNVHTTSVAEAVKQSDVVVLACLWDDIDTALSQAGDLSGKVVIDVTNQYSTEGFLNLPTSVAEYNQARIPGATIVRTFNMLTADFMHEVGDGKHQPVAMFYATNDIAVKPLAEELIAATGFTPVYAGDWSSVAMIEAPNGIVLGKIYSPKEAQKVADTIRGQSIADKMD